MTVAEQASAPRILAAGVVALRGTAKRREVLVVHRPDRRDWSLPKGKVDPGERLAATAVRETLEETGIAVTLGVPLPTVRYRVGGVDSGSVPTARKSVHYWRGVVTDPAIASGDVDIPSRWAANHEIGDVRWVRVRDLPALLTYPHDLKVIEAAMKGPLDTSPFVLLRHAQAEARADFRARLGEDVSDELRPLASVGEQQAQSLIEVLGAYGVQSVASSSAVRCMETVRPFADARGLALVGYDSITEQAFEERPKRGVQDVVRLLHAPVPTAVCIHRPTRKRLMRAIAEETGQPVDLALRPAEYVVFHRSGKRREDGSMAKVRVGRSTILEYGLHALSS